MACKDQGEVHAQFGRWLAQRDLVRRRMKDPNRRKPRPNVKVHAAFGKKNPDKKEASSADSDTRTPTKSLDPRLSMLESKPMSPSLAECALAPKPHLIVPFCPICFQAPCQRYFCPDCRGVAYCSELHRDQHRDLHKMGFRRLALRESIDFVEEHDS